jgi:acetyl-CoA acetyltransferase family protein
MSERIALVHGIRTPFSKAGGSLKDYSADQLGTLCLRELMIQSPIDYAEVDEVIIGNVAQPANAANIARVIALKSGFPDATSAFTVHRNCASGMESITTGMAKLLAGQADVIVAGGTESMSNIPFLFSKKMQNWFELMFKAKTFSQKLKVFSQFKLHFLKPVIGIVEGLTDPVCGLIMGITAENLAKEFKISRADQDSYALESHLKAVMGAGRLAEEIVPIPTPDLETMMANDDGPRKEQSIEALAKLRPYFDRHNGTVTVGNACPLTDGAAMVVLMRESTAKERGLNVLGYVRDCAYSGLEPHRMGLGPVYSTSKVFDKTGLTMNDIDLVEMNEAFAAQILGNLAAFESDQFSQTYLGKDKAVGKIDPSKLNVNGGAIAMGHPVGTSGTRIILTLLKELKRQQLNRGLATICIGGGQGGAVIVEVN